ncbi:MAG TPA: hypothetical protein PK971_05745, partial [Saprospiraceae bacterium]|nr:hypothetical protein [Saprospiraceae bacterium]
ILATLFAFENQAVAFVFHKVWKNRAVGRLIPLTFADASCVLIPAHASRPESLLMLHLLPDSASCRKRNCALKNLCHPTLLPHYFLPNLHP